MPFLFFHCAASNLCVLQINLSYHVCSPVKSTMNRLLSLHGAVKVSSGLSATMMNLSFFQNWRFQRPRFSIYTPFPFHLLLPVHCSSTRQSIGLQQSLAKGPHFKPFCRVRWKLSSTSFKPPPTVPISWIIINWYRSHRYSNHLVCDSVTVHNQDSYANWNHRFHFPLCDLSAKDKPNRPPTAADCTAKLNTNCHRDPEDTTEEN